MPLESIQDLSGVLLVSQTFVFDLNDEAAPVSAEANAVVAEVDEAGNLHFSLLDLGSADSFHFDIQTVASLPGDARSTAGHPIAISHQADADHSLPVTAVANSGVTPAQQHMSGVAPQPAAVVFQTQAMGAAYEFIAEVTPSLSLHPSQAGEATSSDAIESFPLADPLAASTGADAINALKPTASIAQLADYLVNGFWQYYSTIAHHWGSSTITYNIDGLNAAEQTLAISALNAWHEVTNLTFVRTSGSANITYNHNGSMTAYETDNYTGSGIITSATIDISADWITTDGGAYDGKTGIDSYGYQTYIHETGHALGLGHQGPYNGSASYSINAAYANDTWQYSVMSYFGEQNYNGGSYRYVITPQMADIYAVQSVYGAASTRTGDTVYGFNNTAGSIFNFAAYTQAPAYTIYDSGGTDTLDASGYSVAQTIDLRPGNFSSIGGLVHNIGIFTTTVIEKAFGGSGNDTLIANDYGDTLSGGAGNDTLTGGAGADRLISGAGIDTMAGGAGADVFAFLLGDSSAATGQHDLITDFTPGQDKIDLSGFDAIPSTPGILDMFTFLATAVFNGVAGVLDYFFDSSRGVTVVQGDTNGDRVADFAIDLTGNITLTYNDFFGVNPQTVVIETSGSTYLTQTGGLYYLYNTGGSGPSLKLGGADVLVSQYGGWLPIGAEAVSGGYEVAWKLTGSSQYIVWKTDTSGNFVSQLSGAVPGSNYVLQTLETSFLQDLNGDGTTGNVLATSTIETNGATTLLNAADHFYLLAGGLGPTLKLGSSDVLGSQFGGWLPISAEAISGGYEVAWKNAGSGQYIVWNTDSNGVFVSQAIGATSGSNSDLISIETSFHQDLNSDGTIGPVPQVLEVSGSTDLTQIGNKFYLYNTGGTGPSLKLSGADVLAEQYGGWLPIGAEAISGGYEVAWKLTGSDQYIVWATDTNGNFAYQISGVVPAYNYTLQMLENSFQQDLNGDGTVGNVIPTTVIESSGATSLIGADGHFYLGATGPSLKFGGADFISGQFAGWLPIGVEAISGGYEVAWKLSGADQYLVWNTDTRGNYLSQSLGVAPGSNATLKLLELSFQQDLNGDTVTGPVTTPVETSGSTSLTQADGHFYLSSGGSIGPSLKLGGADFISGQFGGWLPIGAEAISGGYEVAWKLTGSDQYLVWATDTNGNYTSQILTATSGSSSGLKAIEPSFLQDLNGDGLIGTSMGGPSGAVQLSNVPAAQISLDSFVFAQDLGAANSFITPAINGTSAYEDFVTQDAATFAAHFDVLNDSVAADPVVMDGSVGSGVALHQYDSFHIL